MSADSKTRARDARDISPGKNPLFGKLPDQYYGYAMQWSFYPRWSIEEAANLLTGCVPHREMFLRGKEHEQLDAEVLTNENRIRTALGKALTPVVNKKYFSRTYVESNELIEWAMAQDMDFPAELFNAYREAHRQREIHGYRTPAMEAVDWVVEHFWQRADMREPPNAGEIVQALLQAFPDLEPEECEMVEHITRHPAAKITLDD